MHCGPCRVVLQQGHVVTRSVIGSPCFVSAELLSYCSLHSFSRGCSGLGQGRSIPRAENAIKTCVKVPHRCSAVKVSEWEGLSRWRQQPIDNGILWGDNRPVDCPDKEVAGFDSSAEAISLAEYGLQVLTTADPLQKAALTHQAWLAYTHGELPLGTVAGPLPPRPARPHKPKLVPPKQVPSYKDSPLPLSAFLLHNLAHIELNAVDLAWDTVVRFSQLQLPPGFYTDFAHVADDEARHLGWCLQRLRELGHSYGDMPAHDLLWQGAAASADCVSARLAIVPMSQEARGLDAGMRLCDRLVGTGDRRSAAVVQRIALEEKAHVAVGVYWFQRVCGALNQDAGTQYRAWLAHLAPDLLKGPFDHTSRNEVGLQRDWYDMQSWPQEKLERLVSPAKAASIVGHGGKVPGSCDAPTVLSGEQLQLLRSRLAIMLELEEAAGGS